MLTLKNISKDVGTEEGKQRILHDVSFTVSPGEFIAIMGQSGSGKSTLMNILGCLDSPSSGSYCVGSVDTGQLSPDGLADLRCDTFGFIFQRYNLLPSLTATENVALPAVYANISDRERKLKAEDILRKFDLASKLTSKPNVMSGGQQQRISIARALMNSGAVILADEPTGALDTQSGKNVMKILGELNAAGHTVILVTHDPTIATYAERVIEIRDGKIVSDTQSRPRRRSPAIPFREPVARRMLRRSQIFEAFQMALHSIQAHKLRSALTALGIIIGIASVVAVIALGRGAQQKVIDDIQAMGTNTITIFPGKGFGDLDSWRVKTLTLSDAEALAEQSYIASASPSIAGQGVATYRNKSATTQLEGVGEQYFATIGISIKQGRQFTKADVATIASVVVIDQNTLDILFQGHNAIEEILFFNKYPLKVIGIAKQNDGMASRSENLSIWVPHSTAMYKLLGSQDISSITVKIADNVNPQVADKNLSLFLASRHNSQQDFFTFNSDSIRQTVKKTTGTLALLISGVAFISLVVGGIGVMNIMLVSVTERTAEIGIRMAIGAKRSHILTQFLIEAVLLCLIGGALGIGLAFFIGFTLTSFFSDIPLAFSTGSVVLALCCALFIGIFFGFMPARNASLLNPINALARE